MTQGYFFPRSSRRSNTRTPIREKTPISAPDMTKVLKVHTRHAGERTAFTTHSPFSSEGPLTRALAGEDLPTVMQRAFWKKPSTAWRYLRLMEVLNPGSVGNSITGVSPKQYEEIHSRLNVVLTYGIRSHTVLVVRRANCPCCNRITCLRTGELYNSFL